jgi:1-acyl-sn-glycerol-3-phosphate acyltransferase
MRTLRSCLFHTVLFISTILLGVSAIVVAYISRRTNWAHLVARLWGNTNLWAAGVNVTVTGLERIERDRTYVYAANHQSWFDIFAILGKLPVQFRWLAKEELFKVFVLGPAMSAAGYIPINRGDRRSAFESMNQAAMKVQQGTSIVIFPEGTRSPDGLLQPFKKGGFVLAIKSRQPIVPVSISGSYPIFPKGGGWKIKPGTIRISIGDPIETAGCTIKDRDDLAAEVREAIRKYLTVKEGGCLPDEAP